MGGTKDLCGTTSYACNIIIHRTRRQAVQHKTHSSRPDSIYNGNTSMPVGRTSPHRRRYFFSV